MEVRQFLTLLARRWLLIVACMVLTTGAAGVVTLLQTPVYEARTRVFLSSRTEGQVLSSSDLDTVIELLRSPVVRDPVRRALGLDAEAPLDISASVTGSTPILDVVVRATDARIAYNAAQQIGPQLTTLSTTYAALFPTAVGGLSVNTLVGPTLPTSPISPNLRINLVVGAGVGLMLGIGIALLVHFLDTRIRTSADVRALTDRPILALLPRSKPGATGIVMEDAPTSLAAEEYRRLRTNLQFVDVTTGGQHSFVVTSAMPAEGKTTTSINLARSFADSGARVLLMDADLRNPSVATTMGLEGGAGLTTVLLGHAQVADVVQRWPDSSLDVLPAGAVPPNPSELLGSEATERLFAEVLADYDMVIVDSPPLNPVVDAVLLGRLTGGLLLVVSAARGRRREVSTALRSLDTVGQEVAGIALNMAPQSDAPDVPYYGHTQEAGDRQGQTAAAKARGASGARTTG